MAHVLYLASQSKARQQLLQFAGIKFKIIYHRSDEQLESHPHVLSDCVQQIACQKMRSLMLPKRQEVGVDVMFALTADTLIMDPRSLEVLAKPTDKNDAVRMLAIAACGEIEVATGVCLEKFRWHDSSWQQDEIRHFSTSTMVEFFVDDTTKYLSELPIALQCSGAGVLEQHGLSYLKSIRGSYTAAMGLPLYEVRQHLKELGFFS